MTILRSKHSNSLWHLRNQVLSAALMSLIVCGCLGCLITTGCKKPKPNSADETNETKTAVDDPALTGSTNDSTSPLANGSSATKSPQTAPQTAGPNNQINSGVQPHPRMDDFSEVQFAKDHTLFVQAFDSVTRQTYFLANYPELNPEQIERVRDLVDSYENQFSDLLNQRAQIMENARDGDQVELRLKNNNIDTLLLGRQVRRTIFKDIMTKEQKEAHKAKAEERKENDKLVVERRKQQEKRLREVEEIRDRKNKEKSEQQNKK